MNTRVQHENPQITDTFYRPCLACGETIEVVVGEEQGHTCVAPETMSVAIAKAYWAGHDRANKKEEVS